MKNRNILSQIVIAVLLSGNIVVAGEGDDNTTYGKDAGASLFGVSIGAEAGSNNLFSDSIGNTFVGDHSGFTNLDGDYNLFTGYNSGYNNQYGNFNVFNGAESGYSNRSGHYNVYTGYQSGYSSKSGNYNTFNGYQSGFNNFNTNRNTFLGYKSGYNSTVASSVFLGYLAGYNATRNNTLYIDNSTTNNPLIYGEFDTDLVRVNGDLNVKGEISTAFTITTKGGVKLETPDREWLLRAIGPGRGFATSRSDTDGNEIYISNYSETDHTQVKVSMGGVIVFEDGHLVTASSRELKTDIKPLTTDAALEAFHKLQPVSYAYKAHKDEPVVGFIAEDVPELVSMPSRKSFDSAEIVAVLTKVVQDQDQKIAALTEKITNLELMQKKVARLESLLTNLALDTSKVKKEKVSLNLK